MLPEENQSICRYRLQDRRREANMALPSATVSGQHVLRARKLAATALYSILVVKAHSHERRR